jgi:hypothetical protein
MPDSRYGAWPSIWFLSNAAFGNAAGGGSEIDLQEGGTGSGIEGTATANQNMASNCHWSGCSHQQTAPPPGSPDLTAAYHVYGMEYLPGKRISMFFDNGLFWQYADVSGDCTAPSQCSTTGSGTVPTSDFELIIEANIGSSSACSFHTCVDGTHNGPFFFYVNDVQLYHK